MMGLAGLALFMVGMWAMVLAVAAFLVIFVAPIDMTLFGGKGGRLSVSAVQAAIAIVVVIALVLGLSRMKRVYMHRKLG
jgi:Na+/melibiose symporter-like transporter